MVLELKQQLESVGFEVTKRTVQRDLDDLSLIFPLQCNSKGVTHGWHWMEGRSFELPSISITDAQSLLLVKDLLKPLVPQALWKNLEQRFSIATQKLQMLEKNNALARWADKVRTVPNAFSLLPPTLDQDVLGVIQDALLHEHQCEVSYQRFGPDAPKFLTIHPLALIQRGPVTYVVATAFDYEDPRLYAVHRIKAARLIDKPVCIPAGFNLDNYVAMDALQFGGGEQIILEARVSDVLGYILLETPLSLDQDLRVTEGDWWSLTATVRDTWQLRWWLKSQGEDIVVRQPKSLRRDLLNEIKRALNNYRDRSLNR